MKPSQVKKDLLKIAKSFKVKLSFTPKSGGGFAIVSSRKISIGEYNLKNPRLAYSCLFHEIAHCLRKDKNKFAYEFLTEKKPKTKDLLRFLKEAYQEELNTEKLGEKLFKDHFLGVKFPKYFRTYKNDRNSITFLFNHFYQFIGPKLMMNLYYDLLKKHKRKYVK